MPCTRRLRQILVHHALNVARRNGVEIENVCDLQPDRLRKRIVEIDLAHLFVKRRARPGLRPTHLASRFAARA
jgi:hypothetical protein